MSGLFSTFNIATRGLSVGQNCIDVTSHNISNANSAGYTRQRALVESSRPEDLSSITSVKKPGQLGTGSQVQSIQRVRDEFLDYQIRNEQSKYGTYSVRKGYLSEIEGVFNEPSDTGITTIMGKFFDSWQQLSKEAQSSNARTVVAQQALALTGTLNSTYTELQSVKEDAGSLIKNSVVQVNTMIKQIDDVNKEIIAVNATGSNPNDLMDKRDYLIDQLSSKFNLVVDKKQFDGLDVRPKDTNGMKMPNLINSKDSKTEARFSYVSAIEQDPGDKSTYKITYYKLGDMQKASNKQAITLTNMTPEQVDELNKNRMIWANKDGIATKVDGSEIKDGSSIDGKELVVFKPSQGEIQGCISVEEDVDKYCAQLDRMAKALAFSVNAVLSGEDDASKCDFTGKKADDFNTNPFFVNSKKVNYDANGNITNIEEQEIEISAANITVNKLMVDDVTLINAGKDKKSGNADGKRALAIASLRNATLPVQDINIYSEHQIAQSTKNPNMTRKDFLNNKTTSKSFFNKNTMEVSGCANGMNIPSYFRDTIDRLGVESQGAMRDTKNEKDLLKQFGNIRKSVSGVSLDEEMANLVKFQHSYAANAKVVATVNDLLDVVINGLIR